MRGPRIPPTRAILFALAGLTFVFADSPFAQVRRAPTSGRISEGPGALTAGMFTHTFDAAQVKALTRTRGEGKYPEAYKAMSSTPPFVLVTAFFLDTAAKTYAGRGVPFDTLFPPPERVGADYRKAGGFPMQFDHRSRRIVVNLTPIAWDLDLHRQRTAHELFHAIQGRMVGGPKSISKDGLWWTEATAEYAACDVVWPQLSNRKGGGRGRAYPYLLDAPLVMTGPPSDDHDTKALGIDWTQGEELEYDKGYFIQYLVEHEGAEFFAMNKAVLDFYGADEDRGALAIYEALNTFLINKSKSLVTLGEAYRGFAAFYLLGASSPVAAAKITRGDVDISVTPLVGVVQGQGGREHAPDRLLADEEGKPAEPLEYTFALRNGYTAKMWAVEADMPKDAGASTATSTRPLRVMAAEVPSEGGMTVRVFKAPRGAWISGEPRPAFTLTRTGDSRTLSIGPEETLYVLATSTSEAMDPNQGRKALKEGVDTRQATVRILGIPPPPRPTPTPTPTPRPTATPVPTRGAPGAGYWRFLESRSVKYVPNPASGFINVSASVSDGSISGTQTDPGQGDGPATWAGECAFVLSAPGGLDRLNPGDSIEASMSVTDRSVPEKGSGWNHGHVGILGSIRFDQPYLGLGVSHQAAADLVNIGATWQKANPTPTATQKTVWKVPAGPGPLDWGGKAALDANCSFGRFERVYGWTTEPYVARPPAARPAPTASPRPSLTGAWNGTWTNGVNERGSDSLVIEEQPDGKLTGMWSGSVPVTGRRLGATTIELTGRTATRLYEVSGELIDGVLTLRYVARRLDTSGSYRGTSTLRR